MKKIITALAIFASSIAFSQVGIGTASPHSSSILDLTASNKALLLPRVANTAAIPSPVNGMMIYDISSKCIKSYENGAWTSCLSSASATASVVVDCDTNAFEGSYTNGIAMTASNKFSVNITNNSFTDVTIALQASDLVLTGVAGISVASVSTASVTLTAGQSQLVEYTLSGMPSASGTLTGTWKKYGLNCVKTVAVTNPAIATLACGAPANSGTLTGGTTASGVSSVISYTGGDGSAHSGQAVTSTGVTGLTATLAAGNFATGAGSLTYTITGNPSAGGTASFAINIGGQNCTFTRTVAAGSISTLNCAGATTTGTLTSGTAASGVSSSVPYSGGNGGSYAAQTVTSTGVTGLTAKLTAGSFATGAGSLTYTITGNPSAGSTASFAINIGGKSCALNVPVAAAAGSITGLDCVGATPTGTLTAGTNASGVSSSVPYSGGNGGSYAAQTVTSTGVTGLTAKLVAGNFATGAGSLTYTITGNPFAGGTASFAINIGGKSCTLTRTVASPITIPATITLAQNRTYIVASVYDQDYLPYTAPTGAATTTAQAANGTNEAVTVNVQGTITTAGVTIKIPVTATGNGTLPAYSQTITIPANLTEEGTSSRDLTLSWASEAYTASTKTINATIAAVGSNLNAKKLDINAGIGNDVLGVLMGQFTYPYNNAGNTTTYSVRDIAGIPDKMFGIADKTGSTTTHMMLYIPVVAEDGNIWLNNNLGAHYANINHTSFNPSKQATSATDFKAYGSLFQWGRKGDGHELITYATVSTGEAANGTTTTRPNADTAADALFIKINSGNYDWRGTTQNDALWASEASANNPCPVGFRVPTLAEQDTLVTAAGITDRDTAAWSTLKFSVPGIRSSFDGSLDSQGSYGRYWSSTVSGTNASYRSFYSTGTSTANNGRSDGLPVRCLKD